MKENSTSWVSWAKTVTMLLLLALVCSASAGLLLDLDASTLARESITAWESKTAGGKLTNAAPINVEKVLGRTAVVFDGRQQLISDFTLPAGFEKSQSFTIEVWAMNPSVERSEAILTLARGGGGPGTEFSFASGPTAGAFRSGHKAATPFKALPSSNEWHHLAWTYAGGNEGVLRVYVDGELDTEQPLKLGLAAQPMIRLGAPGEANSRGPQRGFSGAVSQVRIQNVAMPQAELRKGAGLINPFAPSPQHGATTDSLSLPLHWQRGVPNAVKYVVYVGTDRAAVERGDKSIAHHTTSTETQPLPLKIGTTYFWRVAQLDQLGGIIVPGVTWTFTADLGLASEPQPRGNDGNVATTTTELAWRPGQYASSQHLFFGTNAQVVERAVRTGVELLASARTYPLPTRLLPGTRYYWRVDSDNGAQPSSRGPVWTFRTQDTTVPNEVTFFVGSDTHYGRENNAAINRRVIDEMNALPGTPLPDSIGGGFVRTPLGVVLTGDLLDEGFNKETAPANWAEFCRDYGLTGRDGRLCFPVYEGFGNHDGGPTMSLVRPGIKERNPQRVGIKTISENGLHYAWDWGRLHLVQLNLFGGSGPADVKGVSGINHDPSAALEFLKKDLAENIGTSGRPVIVFQHFGWLGGMSEWWHPEAKERFYQAVKSYNIACLINGHSHGADFLPWHDLLTIHDGSTARGESDNGDFMVVRVTEKELIVIQRKLGEWGIQTRRKLGVPAGSD